MTVVQSGAAENHRIEAGRRIWAVPSMRVRLLFFLAPCCSKGTLAIEDGAEFRRVDVAARNYTDNIALARESRESRGEGGRAGRLGDDTMTGGQQAHRRGNLLERCARRLVDRPAQPR